LPIVHIGKLIAMATRADRERSPFGQRMLKARQHAKLTQIQVRDKLGISQGTLSELEATAHSSGRTVEFAQLYGCDAHWLATGEGLPGWGELVVAPPRRQGEAPPPVADFNAKVVTDSEWGILHDVKLVMTDEELTTIRARAAKVRANYEEVMRREREIVPAEPVAGPAREQFLGAKPRLTPAPKPRTTEKFLNPERPPGAGTGRGGKK
jgi:transcriptional regulator with XRE-family HTH domain